MGCFSYLVENYMRDKKAEASSFFHFFDLNSQQAVLVNKNCKKSLTTDDLLSAQEYKGRD